MKYRIKKTGLQARRIETGKKKHMAQGAGFNRYRVEISNRTQPHIDSMLSICYLAVI